MAPCDPTTPGFQDTLRCPMSMGRNTTRTYFCCWTNEGPRPKGTPFYRNRTPSHKKWETTKNRAESGRIPPIFRRLSWKNGSIDPSDPPDGQPGEALQDAVHKALRPPARHPQNHLGWARSRSARGGPRRGQWALRDPLNMGP